MSAAPEDPQDAPGAPEGFRPYPEVAGELLAGGWGPLPLPYGVKWPPPKGWTGGEVPMPSGADVQAWVEDPKHANANTAARLPEEVVGIDADAYHWLWSKSEEVVDSLLMMELDAGRELPKTVIVGNRADGVSGIRLLRVPAGVDTGQLRENHRRYPHVDLIRHDHRYAVAPGSLHPEGRLYWAKDERTGKVLDSLPPVSELPELPMEWVELLTPPTAQEAPEGTPWTEGQEASEEAQAWALDLLKRQARKVADAEEGGRNNALNEAALIVGHYVPHLLDHALAVDWLTKAANMCGLEKGGARATIASGLAAGMAEPLDADILRAWEDADLPPVDLAGAIKAWPELPEEFWEATEELRHIRQAAHSAQIGAAGLLGAVLARVSMQTNHRIELPGTPNRGSLNMIVGLVAPSGGGKGSSVNVAARLLPGVELGCECGDHPGRGDFITLPSGSGEGLTAAFYESVREGRSKPVWRRDRSHILIDVDEVENLLATMGRAGATIGPVLRSLWSGATAGFQNASADRRFILTPGSYRVALVAGVQPAVVSQLFGDDMGGTPQRWLWMPATGQDVPNLEEEGVELPEWPGELPPVQLEAIGDTWAAWTFEVAPEVTEELRLRRNQKARGTLVVDPLDAHRDFLRLRVAALLARLHRSQVVSVRAWELAGMVMDVSDDTRATMLRESKEQTERRLKGQGAGDAIRQEGREARVLPEVDRVARVMWNKVAKDTKAKAHDPEGSCPRKCAKNAPGGRHSPELKERALDYALAEHWLAEVEEGERSRLILGPSRPAAREGE